MADLIDLGFCPRCKEGFPMMTRNKWGIRWCHLCSFDLEEDRSEKARWVHWAKEYASEMV